MPDITPSLFIGLGGTGHLFTTTVKRIIEDEYLHSDQPFPLCQYLVVDTEFVSMPTEEKQDGLTGDQREYLAKQARADRSFETQTRSRIRDYEKIDISIAPERLMQFLNNPSLVGGDDFIPSAASRIRPGTFGASQVGLLGKIMGIAHFHDIKAKIGEVLGRFAGSAIDAELPYAWPGYHRNPHTHIAVYISCSFGGGTGRGLCLLVASIVRASLREISERVAQEAVITVINFMPDCFQLTGRKVLPETLAPLRANTYAALKELEHVFSSEDPTGGSGAIDMEPYFKSYCGWPPDRPAYLRPIDSVLLLSPKLDGGGAKIQLDNYQQVNDVAARALTSIIFGGKEGPILGALSNVRPPATEAKTKALRPCRYGRMGRGTLRYPVTRLKRYAVCNLGYHALLDLEDGHLTKPPEEHVDTIAHRLIQPITTHVAKLFPAVEPVMYSGLGIGEITFETPIIDNLRNKLSQRLQTMRQHQEAADLRLFNDENDRQPSFLTIQTKELRQSLIDAIEPYGIRRALALVDKMLNYASQFQFSELQQLGMESREELEQNISELEALGQQFVDGSYSGFKAIEECLQQDREAWQRGRSFFTKVAIKPDQPRNVSGATKDSTCQVISAFHEKVAHPLHLARRLLAQVKFFDTYREVLRKFHDELTNASSILTNKDKWGRDLGLVAQYESEMERRARLPPDPSEVYVYGRSSEDYKRYCEQLTNRKAMLDAIQHQLNERIVPIIVDLDRSLSAELLREVLDAEVVRQVSRELADESITTFLQRLTAEGREIEVNRFWTDLEKQSAWLGTVDNTRIKVDEAAGKDFKKFTFIELADSRAIEASEAARRYFTSASQIVNPNLNEVIVVSRYQFHMPLFAHDSARNHLASEYERLVRSHENQEQAQEALARYHTSRQFFYLNEPFDRVSLIPEAERELTLNLMLHLGVFGVDDHGYLECRQRKAGREGHEMRRWLTDRYKVDESQAVMFETFAANPGMHAELTEHLLERTSSLFSKMARDKGLHEALRGYLAMFEYPERYPLVPETLLQNRLLRDTIFKNYFESKFSTDYRRKLAGASGPERPPVYFTVDDMMEDDYVDPRSLWDKLHRREVGADGKKRRLTTNVPTQVPKNGESDDASAVPTIPPGTLSLSPEFMALCEILKHLRDDSVITRVMYDGKMSELISSTGNGTSPGPLLAQIKLLMRLHEEGTIPRDHFQTTIREFFAESSPEA